MCAVESGWLLGDEHPKMKEAHFDGWAEDAKNIALAQLRKVVERLGEKGSPDIAPHLTWREWQKLRKEAGL